MISSVSNNLVMLIFIVVAIIVGVYFTLRKLKGSIKINLYNAHNVSETDIQGDVDVLLKKEVVVERFYIALIGEEETYRRTRNGNQRSWREFYRDELDLPQNNLSEIGVSHKINFKLTKPTSPNVSDKLDSIKSKSDSATVNTLINVGVGVLKHTMHNKRTRWYLKVKLELKGVDLSAKKKIHINYNF